MSVPSVGIGERYYGKNVQTAGIFMGLRKRTMMPEPLWKQVQRRHYRDSGGDDKPFKRTGIGQAGPDSQPRQWLIVESKQRKKLPKWLKRAVDKVHNVTEEDQLGIVRLHETNAYYTDDIVCIKYEDFRAWFENGTK